MRLTDCISPGALGHCYFPNPLDDDFVTVRGAAGQSEKAHFLKPLKYTSGKQGRIHKFFYMLNSSKPLLGWDLLEQFGAEITFESGKFEFKVQDDHLIEIISSALVRSQLRQGYQRGLKTRFIQGCGLLKCPDEPKPLPPIVIRLKSGVHPVRIKQYPIRTEDRKGIQQIIDRFIKTRLLKKCESECNTPILPVKKPDGDYRIVQDLRDVNKIAEDLHPLVRNPYALLLKLISELAWFTVLDLKDAFCLSLASVSLFLHLNGKTLIHEEKHN